MAGLAIIAQIVQGLDLVKRLNADSSIDKPAQDGVRNIAKRLEAETKRATEVDTGRLRASMTHCMIGMGAEVGSNVKYASFVEYGTENMEARHMEGSRKILGLGMLGYALQAIKGWAAQQGNEIAKNIADKIVYGR